MKNLFTFYDRALNGPRVDEKEFDMRIIPSKSKELAKKYEIQYSPNEVVPRDLDMAKRTFDAAIELLLSVGVYCRDTQRIIEFSADEIKNALNNVNSTFIMGENSESVICKARSLGDKKKPCIVGGPNGAPISENNNINILNSYAKEAIDCLHTGSLVSIFGRNIRARTVSEVVACKYEAIWAREAIRRAGKPGLSITGIMSGVSSEAQNSGDFIGGLRPSDKHLISFLNELKVDWEVMNKILHNHNIGNIIDANQGGPIIGGYSGGPESSAVVAVAEMIQIYLMAQPRTISMDAHHIIYGWSHKSAIWVNCMTSLAFQCAGIPVILGYYLGCSSGPCTEMLCDEIAALSIALTSVGGSFFIGPVGCKMKLEDHFSGMESRILNDICTAAVNIDLDNANHVVSQLVDNYDLFLTGKNISMGKSFLECYNVDKMEPSHEYMSLWEKKKKEYRNLGLFIS